MQLTATAIYSDSSSADVTAQVAWSSSNTAVASVRPTDGKALAVSAGSSVVTATLNRVTSASTTLTVTSATLVSIAITPPASNIPLGTTQQFVAIGAYTDNSTKNLTTQVTWVSATVSQYTIGVGGALSPMSSAPITAGTVPGGGPHSITVDLSGRYAYAANADGTVSQYTIGANGALSAMSPVTDAAGSQLYSLNVDPTGRYAYVANTDDSTVMQYTIGMGGALSAMSPASIHTGFGLASLAVDPSGRHVYVANDSDGTVSQYKIVASGSLSAMSPATVATESRPLSVAVDPTGRYAYVANYGDGINASTVSQFTIGTDGALNAMSPSTVAAGIKPFSIITTD
jgi:6-phosphogluconolactonase (cycloisomerase 2 family)